LLPCAHAAVAELVSTGHLDPTSIPVFGVLQIS
jgi:hypothetical protein